MLNRLRQLLVEHDGIPGVRAQRRGRRTSSPRQDGPYGHARLRNTQVDMGFRPPGTDLVSVFSPGWAKVFVTDPLYRHSCFVPRPRDLYQVLSHVPGSSEQLWEVAPGPPN